MCRCMHALSGILSPSLTEKVANAPLNLFHGIDRLFDVIIVIYHTGCSSNNILTLYTLTPLCIFSILFSIHSPGSNKENL